MKMIGLKSKFSQTLKTTLELSQRDSSTNMKKIEIYSNKEINRTILFYFHPYSIFLHPLSNSI